MWCNKLLKTCSTFHISSKYLHRIKLKMENAYFRYFDGDDHFEMILKFTSPTLGIERQFNFKRQISESVDSFLGRVSTNVEKITSKKTKKKKNQPASTPEPVIVELLTENDEQVDKSLDCKQVFTQNRNLRIKIQECFYSIKINTPWVDKITLPGSILSGFPVYPNKFDVFFTNKKNSIFSWSRSKDGKEWEVVGREFFYIPTPNDVGCTLKLSCQPGNEDTHGPEVEVVAPVPVEAGPGVCPFEIRHLFTEKRLSGKAFRCVAYNILADLYCDSDYSRECLFPYCPPYALALDYRKQLILKELIGYNGDLICLQEVDEKMYLYELIPVLSNLNYEGVFHKKGGTVTEGLSCLYNTNRFKLLSTETIILGEELSTNEIFSDLWKQVQSNTKFCERILPRTTAVQHSVFETTDGNNEILVVGNTHLYFHPDADHVRLFQGGMIIKYLTHVVDKIKKMHANKRVSLILCGDFNSVPECGIYKLMTTGEVNHDFIDWISNEEEAVKNVTLTQPFKLDSAGGTPKYTNFTAGFAACLDYIFYQTDNLEVQRVIPFPSDEELRANTALPSIVFPSDHVAVVSDLEWK